MINTFFNKHKQFSNLPKKLKFYHGLIFFVVINLIAGYGVSLFVDVKSVYSNLKLPWIAPPVWLFGFAWTFNNICMIYGNILAYNLENSSQNAVLKSKFLKLQCFSWLNYLVFQYLSFGTKIPAMFFIPTFSMLVINIFSIYYAYKLDTIDMSFWSKVKSGKSIFMSLVSLVSWLIIASILGLSIMLYN